MGGSILFTQSTTFDPKVYGLVANKFINYIIIGGGGAGGSVGCYTASNDWSYTTIVLNSGGSNGGASSIGSYVSAAGGKTPTLSSSTTSFTMYRPLAWETHETTSYYDDCCGGNGAGGWVPGKIFNSYQDGGKPYYSKASTDLTASDSYLLYQDGEYRIVRHINSGSMVAYPTAGAIGSSGSANPYNLIQNKGKSRQGNDGIGYGAGGGGIPGIRAQYDGSGDRAIASPGGNSGEFKQGSFKLTSTDTIAITIGAGGTPHTSAVWPSDATFTVTARYTDNDSYWSYGRIGTHGAVMLFWD